MQRWWWLLCCAPALAKQNYWGGPKNGVEGPNETYAVLAYGRGGYLAGAVVLGSVLRRLDPSRHRTALVVNVTGTARDALAADELWDVRESVSWRRRVAARTSPRPNLRALKKRWAEPRRASRNASRSKSR